MVSTILLCLLSVFSFAHSTKDTLPFEDISEDIFGGHRSARIAAFTDINSDKRTDLITISLPDKVLQVLYSGDDKNSVASSQLLQLSDAADLSTVVPGDFDGDLVTDFLFIYKLADKNLHRLELCFGSKSTLHYGDCMNISQCLGEPLILDYNADMTPDILLENRDGALILLTSHSRNFSSETIDSSKLGRLLHPHSSAFVDLNGDLAADIALTVKNGLAISTNKDGAFDIAAGACIIHWPSTEPLGMASFLDHDSDSYMDVLVSSTKDSQTSLYVVDGEALTAWLQGGCSQPPPAWNKVIVSLVDDSKQSWSLSKTDSWLRGGDVDNDGYFDLLVTLTNKDNSAVRPFILRNVECNGTCPGGRAFSVMWEWLPVDHNITQVAFYDIFHRGMLDVLYNADHGDYTELHVLQGTVAKQACFVSVKVGSGLCTYDDEDNCDKPYSNIVGPTVQYNSTHPDGSEAFGIATQLSQATNGALQIPYIQFGLGTTPNFVDSLSVGIARQRKDQKWSQTWTTLIPNSHLVVVPRPPDKPDQWLMHLYVTPSHLVLITAVVILSLCALIAIIIALLHLRDKRQDKLVKSQEAHRFHFNAM